MSRPLSHLGPDGRARMVDVGPKPETERLAIASGLVTMAPATAVAVRSGKIGKGDVLAVARLAGIMAAKRTAELIPLCHPLPLAAVTVDCMARPADNAVEVVATVKVTGRTGVEMEAMTAASIAALTIYDMCKAIDRAMVVSNIRLVHKSGGKSGTYEAP